MGAGRRSCPAIQFSSVIIELALANVVQKFDRKLSTSAEDLDMACVKDLLLNSIAVPHRSSACKGLHTLGMQIIWRPWLLLWVSSWCSSSLNKSWILFQGRLFKGGHTAPARYVYCGY